MVPERPDFDPTMDTPYLLSRPPRHALWDVFVSILEKIDDTYASHYFQLN